MSLKITLQPNDHLWSPQGFHILDDKSIAIICEAEVEVEFDSQETLDRVMPIIEARRVEYTVVPEPEPVIEEPVEEENV